MAVAYELLPEDLSDIQNTELRRALVDYTWVPSQALIDFRALFPALRHADVVKVYLYHPDTEEQTYATVRDTTPCLFFFDASRNEFVRGVARQWLTDDEVRDLGHNTTINGWYRDNAIPAVFPVPFQFPPTYWADALPDIFVIELAHLDWEAELGRPLTINDFYLVGDGVLRGGMVFPIKVALDEDNVYYFVSTRIYVISEEHKVRDFIDLLNSQRFAKITPSIYPDELPFIDNVDQTYVIQLDT